jgi:transposase
LLDEVTRSAILRLRDEGHGTRRIAKALGISRAAVRSVVERGNAEVPRLARTELAEAHRTEILELYHSCKGNLVRVHEELVAGGATLSYQALTAFCRRHGIGHEPKKPAGQYHFKPGEEMQHDTSPHQIKILGKLVHVETASLVLAHSRMLYFQHYPRFTRFVCKTFIHDALLYLGAVCQRCMIDNTHVVVLRGTGKDMVPVPEMEAFGERYGFTWVAHEIGDADRKARVERRFWWIETNFHAGRDFASLDDANAAAVAWCDEKNAKLNKKLHASPRELFAAERTHMTRLPDFLPEPYQLHDRIVDVEGYVTVHGMKYSAPYRLIGRRLEVRETKNRIELFEGPRSVGVHNKVVGKNPTHVSLPEHRPPRGTLAAQRPPSNDETALAAIPGVAEYVAALKDRGHGVLAIRRLARMMREYPRAAFTDAVITAAHYGLYDLQRVENMVLRNVGKDFFPRVLGNSDDKDPDDDDDR